MRRRHAAGIGLGVIAAASAMAYAALAEPEPVYGRRRGEAPEDALWVVSYNINFERPDRSSVEALAAIEADVIFLQETHPEWEALLREGLGARFAHMEFRHADAEGGMAILSRYPIAERAYAPSPEGAFPAWWVTLETPLGHIEALHVHLHPPLGEDGRLITGYFTTGERRERELRAHLSLAPRAPDLVVGDFNEGSGEAVSALEALGLRQAQTALGPPERTWSWDVDVTELEGRPDHVFFGAALEVAAVQVHQTGASDHRPLRAALVRAP